MNEIKSYPFAFGVLSAKVQMIGYDLVKAGIITYADLDKVDALANGYIEHATRAANDYASESGR